MKQPTTKEKDIASKLGMSVAALAGLYIILKIGKYLFYLIAIWYFLVWIMQLIEWNLKST